MREVLDRLDRIERKLGEVHTFTGTLQQLLSAWMTGGRGRLLTALAKAKGGTG